MALEENTVAPLFTAPASNSNRFALKDLRGRWVLLYFYPEDDTPTCTAQACSFRDSMPELQSMGIHVVGVSPDTVESHHRFIDKYQLNYTLVADPKMAIIKKYDVWQLKKLYGREYMGIVRTSYLIDPQGRIRKAWSNVRHAHQLKQIREAMDVLSR